MKFTYTAILILAVSAVAIADVFLKKAAVTGNMIATLKSPWMVGAIALYLFQIFFFTYVFVMGVRLVNVGILQTVLYAAIVLASGVLLFGETLTTLQVVGVVAAVGGVILMNL